jgi:hypothetical protein
MATTTNYGWTTPDDTALVKDGAAAIRTLGSSVDTTTKALNPSTTLGDIEYRSSTANTNTRLGIGSTGNILTVSGGVPTWAAPAASGGITLISDTVANANSSISLSSIPQTYKQLVLVWSGIRHSTTGSTFGLRLNNNSGNIYHCAGQSGLTTNSATTANATNQIQGFCAGIYLPAFGDSVNSNSYEEQCMGYITIDNYTSSTLTPSVNVKYAYFNNSAAQMNSSVIQCQFNGGAAITSIDIVRLTGSATLSNQYNTISSIRLYGVS